MVCLYCQAETAVINSRYQKRNNSTWRRRKCLNCQALFTSTESYDLSSSIKVLDSNGTLSNFQNDMIYVDIFGAIDHVEQNRTQIARDLTDSVRDRILRTNELKMAQISSNDISRAIVWVLKHYDLSAALKYLSYRSKLTSLKEINNYLNI